MAKVTIELEDTPQGTIAFRAIYDPPMQPAALECGCDNCTTPAQQVGRDLLAHATANTTTVGAPHVVYETRPEERS